MKIVEEINEHIFRDYDIRGIFEKDLTIDLAYTIGLAFGSKLKEEKKTTTVIGYDNRASSPELFKALAHGITETGINVINIGLVTTPMYYYALTLYHTASGIMITGSHNPKEYNGFKISFNGIHNTYGEHIQTFKRIVLGKKYTSGKGLITNLNIEEKYIEYILSSINLGPNKPKIVVDCGNGTASIIIEKILKKLNIDYIPLYCVSDPNYPHHHPDPSVPKNLADLRCAVIEHDADIGFAYDGDADRIGLVDEKGNIINADYFMIIIIRNIINQLNNKSILYDVKCSKALEDEIIKLGGEPICYRTGNSYLRAKIAEDNILFGGELSGHIFFNDKFHGFDDGIYASLRMIEIFSNSNMKVSNMLAGINQYYSTEEIKININDNIKFSKINEVINYCQEKKYHLLTIDGCKVLFNDGFALIRASNTGPNITMRFEATTKERLAEIKEEFENFMFSITKEVV